MTFTMDKKIIFSNIDEWEEFCKYVNANLEWSNPLLKKETFEAYHFNKYRKTVRWITEYLTETYFNKYLFVGIKGKEVYIFVNRTPTDEELEELSFKIEDFI